MNFKMVQKFGFWNERSLDEAVARYHQSREADECGGKTERFLWMKQYDSTLPLFIGYSTSIDQAQSVLLETLIEAEDEQSEFLIEWKQSLPQSFDSLATLVEG